MIEICAGGVCGLEGKCAVGGGSRFWCVGGVAGLHSTAIERGYSWRDGVLRGRGGGVWSGAREEGEAVFGKMCVMTTRNVWAGERGGG